MYEPEFVLSYYFMIPCIYVLIVNEKFGKQTQKQLIKRKNITTFITSDSEKDRALTRQTIHNCEIKFATVHS